MKHLKPLVEAVGRFQNKQDIINFTDSETQSRKRDRKSAITKRLDQTQWKVVRKRFHLIATRQDATPSSMKTIRKELKSWITDTFLQL